MKKNLFINFYTTRNLYLLQIFILMILILLFNTNEITFCESETPNVPVSSESAIKLEGVPLNPERPEDNFGLHVAIRTFVASGFILTGDYALVQLLYASSH